MFHPAESFGFIWAIWAFSMVLVAWLTIRGLRRVRWPHLRALAFDEEGAAYTLSYVMVTPLYIFFMCLVVETTLMILAKFGTNYAAYAGARSAIVHYSNADASDFAKVKSAEALAARWAQWSSVKAFVPFANGIAEPTGISSNNGNQDAVDADRLLRAYQAYSSQTGKPASEKYLRSKYRYAVANLACTLKFENAPADEPWLVDLKVDVDYRYSFHVPGVARLLGKKDANGRFYMLHSTATLQSESPKNDEQTLGINYEPWRENPPWK